MYICVAGYAGVCRTNGGFGIFANPFGPSPMCKRRTRHAYPLFPFLRVFSRETAYRNRLVGSVWLFRRQRSHVPGRHAVAHPVRFRFFPVSTHTHTLADKRTGAEHVKPRDYSGARYAAPITCSALPANGRKIPGKDEMISEDVAVRFGPVRACRRISPRRRVDGLLRDIISPVGRFTGTVALFFLDSRRNGRRIDFTTARVRARRV